jgi:MATE family multidrug resistance protein
MDGPEGEVAQGTVLPARRIDAHGKAHVDLHAIILLSAPLILNSGVQTLLNLTDTWFIGRLSTDALAAMGTIYWPIIAIIMLLSGVGMAVQTVVAQAFGARQLRRAAQATWLGLWSSMFAIPVFAAVALAGPLMLKPFGLEPEIDRLAADFWFPRLLGAPIGLALWAVFGFFNGIGRTKVTVAVSSCVAIANIALNPLFMFRLGLGMAGSAWATNVAMAIGLVIALLVWHSPRYRESYSVSHTRAIDWPLLRRQFALGFPMGLLYAADLIGASFFMLMETDLSAADGATTQIVMMLTSVAYMPGVGIAMAGTTLVGQAIGAGDRAWAFRVGNTVVALAAGYMGAIGVVLAALGPWILPLFVPANDPLDRGGLSILRRTQPRQQLRIARRRRVRGPGRARDRPVVVRVRADRPHVHLRPLAGVGRRTAAARLGLDRRLARAFRLCTAAGSGAPPALAFARVAEDPALRLTPRRWSACRRASF